MDADRGALPRIVVDAGALDGIAADAAGSIWQLQPDDRDLDANVIALPAGDEIREHDGPSLGVLITIIAGSGTLETVGDDVALAVGAVVWLPARSRRRFVAGADGLRYLSVHQRKRGLSISSPAPAA